MIAACPSALIVRTAVVYGPEEAGKNVAYRVANWAQEEAKSFPAGGGQPRSMPVPGDQISSPTYSRDLAHGILSLVEADAPGGVYNIVGDEALSRANLAREILSTIAETRPRGARTRHPLPEPGRRCDRRLHPHSGPGLLALLSWRLASIDTRPHRRKPTRLLDGLRVGRLCILP